MGLELAQEINPCSSSQKSLEKLYKIEKVIQDKSFV